ncbi:MAG: hypothetical protein U9Q31_01355 [Chloroflexota bacterium]|nr:hypothetical protein [Chloroflexota bacterium]
MLVTMVQGWCKKYAGVNPKKYSISGRTEENRKIKKFARIKNQMTLKPEDL